MLSLLQENLQPVLAAPGEGVIEGAVVSAVQWLRLAVETVGAATFLVMFVADSFPDPEREEKQEGETAGGDEAGYWKTKGGAK